MTIGAILYYGGFGVLALAILLALIFAIHRPKYKPPESLQEKQSDASLPEGDSKPLDLHETQLLKTETADFSQEQTVLLKDPDRTMMLPPDR